MLTQSFAFPNSVELREIEAVKLPRLLLNSPVFNLFPFEGKRTHLLEWEQKDSYGGMQQIRGLNGEPPRVGRVGRKSYLMKPGVYGEHSPVDEQEMTTRAAASARGISVNIDDLVTEQQDYLLHRRLNRVEWLCWQLLVNGHFVVLDAMGVVEHKDAYAIQEYTAPIPWSARDTAEPLNDLGAIALLARGMDTAFDQGANIYMNRVTANHFVRNTNLEDVGGRRIAFSGLTSPLGSVNSLNSILTEGSLPNVVVYDEGWHDEAGNFNLYIPDGVAIAVGRRLNGDPLGAYRFTLNVNNQGSEPAPYTEVIDNLGRGIPRKIEVHDGHNGGPVIFYPGSVVKMNVG